MLRRVLLAIAAALVVVAVVLAVSGGFRTTVGGFRISARSPVAASIAALIAGAVWLAMARRDRAIATDLEETWRGLERHASRAIGVIALFAAIVASTFATRSAAGADASGYLSQAAVWSVVQPAGYVEMIAREHHELDGWTTTPLGWRPVSGACDFECEGMQLPTYPPGLPLLMAVPHLLAGINGATAVVTASAAIATWATGMIAGGVAGIMAATFLAFAPVFVHQSIQPMSDVPVTAAWILCFLLVRRDKRLGFSLAAGFACAIAVLVRPNLAPLAIVPFLVSRQKRWFAPPVAAAGIFLAVIHDFWYGSPFRSGYGTAGELFSTANVLPNAGGYASWLAATSPILLLGLFGITRVRKNRHASALMVFALLVIASYLIYAVFDHWSYLRFLLPALAVFAIFAGIELHAWIDRRPAAWRLPLFLGLTLAITAHSLLVARTLEVFKLADQLRRVERAADFINRTAPRDAVMIAGEQSGSMRYYTGRSILRWDIATPDQLSNALTALALGERPIFVVLDGWEHEPFLAKFKDVPAVALDWPAAIDAGTSHRTRVWRLSDRARFLKGENLSTTRLP